ncbi:hypothetical protein [Pseudomonas syringae]|uniref:hypothetical protein n=1 Tax=Pseudomonas syringae TaxID=317 RepID=UPI0002A7B39F|nr:hypothetical protein [Pseudomonas syringae]ELP98740.1 hypothetical protein A979_15888 [Pseudomonas syringae BRIP34876]ELQ04483.1 hypothetical protein A987_08293 [Pseudomonas syringae BRIP34881]
MTVIKYPPSLTNYPLRWVSGEAQAIVEARMIDAHASNGQAMRLIECVAHMADIPLGSTCLTDGSLKKVIGLLVEALKDNSLVELGKLARGRYINKFTSIFPSEPCNDATFQVKESSSHGSGSASQIWQQVAGACSKQTLRYWNGWPLVSRKRQTKYLSIPQIWISHGSEFAEKAYGALYSYYLKQARPSIAVHNKVFDHIHRHRDRWPEETFQDPDRLDEFFKEVMSATFLDMYDRGRDTDAYRRIWNTSMLCFENSLIARGIWAAPYAGLPRAPAGDEVYHWRRIGKDGGEFIGKTITRVPMEVTDAQAMKVLFGDIQSDLKTVLDWAQDSAYNLRERSVMRRYLATRSDGDQLLNDHSLGYVAECRKFEADGFRHEQNYVDSTFGQDLKAHLSYNFGLPISHSLFPFQLLIVNQQPAITPTFLYDLVLFKPNGDPYGFRRIDDVYYLTSRKDRLGPEKAEQTLVLTTAGAKLVMQVIRITQPLRDRLKKDGNDAWRYLFLSCGPALDYPRKSTPTQFNKHTLTTSTGQNTLSGFSRFTSMRGEKLFDFVCRVSLASVRATVGLNIYIETGSVTKMAKALGHTSRSVTLEHYLPKSILDFFEVRWVRVFQRNMVCLAMEDSPYLFRASHFRSMKELDTFLRNHALAQIPYHMKDPERKESASALPDTVYIHVSVGILTILLSLEKAVEQAKCSPEAGKQNISGYAAYWSRFYRALANDINNSNDRVLQGYLETARKHASPELAQEFIYEAA